MLIPTGHVFAACSPIIPCKPYFKVFGGDIFAGGWFTQDGFCSTTSPNYQDDTRSGSLNYGGIMAYTKLVGTGGDNSPAGGASSQYGAFSLGQVEGDNSQFRGLYSNGANSTTVKTPSSLTFANSVNTPYGGQFQGTIKQSHCIPDYYSKQPTPPTALVNGILDNNTASGSYSTCPIGTCSLKNLTNDANVSLATNRKITIYAPNSVYISGNIIYGGTPDADNIPKFALIVKGSIYIAPTVTRLDGLYIAQPDTSAPNYLDGDNGNIWTCANNSTNAVSASYILGQCTGIPGTRILRVLNGAFIAKQINLTRTTGDVNSQNAKTTEDSYGAGSVSTNLAEFFNESPLMLMGGGFFNPTDKPPLNIESLVSMPPTL
jgi:hypothetical protein